MDEARIDDEELSRLKGNSLELTLIYLLVVSSFLVLVFVKMRSGYEIERVVWCEGHNNKVTCASGVSFKLQ